MKAAFPFLIILLITGSVHSSNLENEKGVTAGFKSATDFTSHTNGSVTCTSGQCHSEFKAREKNMHEPAASGMCSECHSAGAYPNRFGLDQNERMTCARCHKQVEQIIKSGMFVHGPIKNGDCTSCHDPHGSMQPFLLRTPYNKLCASCHKTAGFNARSFLHEPVKDGNCGICHDPHASDYESRLVDTGANLCITCHEDMITGMTKNFVHEPLLKSGCSVCHDPHEGDNKLRLKAAPDRLCYKCHANKKIEVGQYIHKHDPAARGLCIECHSPHYSDNKHLLKDRVDSICYGCHKKKSAWKDRRYKHGPVAQGNCTACHNPHGSDNAFILRLAFPHNFYSEYKQNKYDLCFRCHIEGLVTAEKTKTITEFRNGETNLHSLHVMQKKGRTCRACHNVHASDQEGRIRDSFPYGAIEMPLEFYKTKTGGFCATGCHKPMTYDRLHAVDNSR